MVFYKYEKRNCLLSFSTFLIAISSTILKDLKWKDGNFTYDTVGIIPLNEKMSTFLTYENIQI